jgi:hypothetical protein
MSLSPVVTLIDNLSLNRTTPKLRMKRNPSMMMKRKRRLRTT